MNVDDSQRRNHQELPPRSQQSRKFGQHRFVEQTLAPYQVMSTRALAQSLEQSGRITNTTLNATLNALNIISRELDETGSVEVLDALHQTAFGHSYDRYVDRRLQELLGDLRDEIKVGKSRNDQLSTDIRLFLRQSCLEIYQLLLVTERTILIQAELRSDVVMPGYAHMQPAGGQPLSHFFLANASRFARDRMRLSEVFSHINRCPFGAGSKLAGEEPNHRKAIAELLAFDSVIENSLDAISDRDFLVDFASFAAIVGIHTSQLATELLLWSTQEFGFIRLPRDFVFHSHKFSRNGEILELLRSRTSLFSARLVEILTQLKAVPVSYSYDLEESLPALVDMVNNLKLVLELLSAFLPNIAYDVQKMHEKASVDLQSAGNTIDFLVEKGFEADKARGIVDNVIKYCRQRNKQLADLAPNEWQQFSPAFDEEIYRYVVIEDSSNSGGSDLTDDEPVREDIKRAALVLERDERWLVESKEKIKASEQFS